MQRFFSPTDTNETFLRGAEDDLHTHRPTLVLPAYVHMGRFVPGFQSGIGYELTTAAIHAVKCSSLDTDAIFPIRPRNIV